MRRQQCITAVAGIWFVACCGCSCGSGKSGQVAAPASPCPTQKLDAFRLIVEEVKKLPPSDEFYREKPRDVQETLARVTSRQVAMIDGMVAVFQIIQFDSAASREDANEIYTLYQSIVGDRYREPYGGLLRNIEAAVGPIIKNVEENRGK